MDDFYREHILDHYRNPRNFGKLDAPTISFEDRNPLCGDEISIDLLVDADGRVADVRFSGKGCTISSSRNVDAHRVYPRTKAYRRGRVP